MIASLLLSLLASLGGAEPPATLPLHPAITGRAVARGAHPIADARITAAGKPLGRAAADGRFSIPAPQPLPESVSVEAPSYATRTLPLAAGATDLGDVLLLRAARLVVDLSKTPGVRELSLAPYVGRRDARRTATKAASRHVTFDGLEPGEYLLTVRGAAPLQQKSQIVRVAEGTTERVAVTIDHMPLRGYVYLGREPLAGAEIEITGPAAAWHGTLHADADGRFGAELWQVGPLQALVKSPRLATEYATGHRVTEALERDAVEWNIAVPDRHVTGRVVDAATGAPVAHAAVSLEAADDEYHARLNVRTGDDGTFDYAAARNAHYTLDVDSQQYLKPPTVAFTLAEGDPSKNVTIRLDRGAEVKVRVWRENGTPAAGAVVADGLLPDGTRPIARYRTSNTGEVALRGTPGEAKTLYVIPADGSFAIAHVQVDAQALQHGVDVTVPPPSSSLVIRTRDRSGAPLDGVRFLVRYNGELLPPPILSLLARVQQLDYRTTAAGEARVNGLPNGTYELWAYRTPEEAERLTEHAEGYKPSLQVALAGGTYEAELTFGAPAK